MDGIGATLLIIFASWLVGWMMRGSLEEAKAKSKAVVDPASYVAGFTFGVQTMKDGAAPAAPQPEK